MTLDVPKDEAEETEGSAGFRAFVWVCLCQTVSLIGTQLTGFGLGLTVFQDTGSSSRYALLLFAVVAPEVLLAPFAGVLADRFDRRRLLAASHAAAGACSVCLAVLWGAGMLAFPVAFTLVAIGSACASVQFPAVSAMISQLVPVRHFGRASGLVQLGFALSRLVAPVAGGSILLHASLLPILVTDVVTFSFAVVVLLAIRMPAGRPRELPPDHESWRDELLEGWRFVRLHRGLHWLVLFGAVMSGIFGMVEATITPLMLGFANSQEVGIVLSLGGIGMAIGSTVILVWGGPERKILGVYAFSAIQGSCLLLAVLDASLWLVAIGIFGVMSTMAMSISCAQAIFQARVPHELLGRVTAVRSLIGGGAMPMGFLVGGWLADQVFEPLLQPHGRLAPLLGPLIGVGDGRGIALMFLVLSGISLACVVFAIALRSLRNVERDDERAAPPLSTTQRLWVADPALDRSEFDPNGSIGRELS